MKRCDRCRFWIKDKEEDGDANCRRYPPVPFLQMVISPITQQKGVIVLAYWSKTRPELWCGAYRLHLIRFCRHLIGRTIGFLFIHTKASMAKDTTTVDQGRGECLNKEKSKDILAAVPPNQKTPLN